MAHDDSYLGRLIMVLVMPGRRLSSRFFLPASRPGTITYNRMISVHIVLFEFERFGFDSGATLSCSMFFINHKRT